MSQKIIYPILVALVALLVATFSLLIREKKRNDVIVASYANAVVEMMQTGEFLANQGIPKNAHRIKVLEMSRMDAVKLFVNYDLSQGNAPFVVFYKNDLLLKSEVLTEPEKKKLATYMLEHE